MKIYNIPDSSQLLKYVSRIECGNPTLKPIPSDFSEFINIKLISINGGVFFSEFNNIIWPLSVERIYFHNDQLSGYIPDLSYLPNLWQLSLHNNQLSGSISNIVMPSLKVINVGNNQLSGPFPFSQNGLPTIESLHFYNNNCSGEMPSLEIFPVLSSLAFSWNSFDEVAGDFSVPFSLQTLEARGNNFSEQAIDKILVAFDTAGATGGQLQLHQGGNSPPSSVGDEAKMNLISKGWSVQTN